MKKFEQLFMLKKRRIFKMLLVMKITMAFVLLASLQLAARTYSQDIRVGGKVTSPTGDPIPSATIKVKGSNLSTSTDSAGVFSISVPEGATLVISSVGYTTQDVPVN